MKRRLLALGMTLSMLLSAVPAAASAEEAVSAAETNNIGSQDYSVWSSTVKSYLADNGDGTVTRVEYTGESVVVETYNERYQIQSQKTIDMALPLFGGFYSGSEYNFLVFGQENTSEDNDCEVFRIVKYSKDWEELGYAYLTGANTYVPFDAGSLRMVELNGGLYIHTSHTMYGTAGVHHQANVTIAIKIGDMSVVDYNVGITNISTGYVSHSFNQFIAVDANGQLIAADHGDSYPRAIVLTRYDKTGGNKIVLGSWGDVSSAEALSIPGTVGSNTTHAAIGGLACSDTADLVAGCAADFTDESVSDKTRNIFVASVPVNDFSDEGAVYHQITNYTTEDNPTVSVPQLVKVDDNEFLLMWTEDYQILNYVFLDGNGNMEGSIYTQEKVYLSDCQPVVVDNEVVWYVTDESEPQFYAIDLDAPETVKVIDPNAVVEEEPEETPEPEETVPAETPEPEETVPVETPKTEETVPAETPEPVETVPVETPEPVETTPVETPELVEETVPAETPEPEEQPTVDLAQVAAERFGDVDFSDWFATYVGRAYELGIMTGTGADSFEPDGSTTRSAFVQSLYAMKGKPAVTGETPFIDLTEDWYKDAVLWAYLNNVTEGTSENTFGPEEPVTREQIAVFLYAYAGSPVVIGDLSQFPDASELDDYSATALLWAVQNGLIAGSDEDGVIYLNPTATATRGETATMMVGFYQYLNR